MDRTAITDAGLAHLAGLKRCTKLSVRGTEVTPAGAAAMQARCPWMNIESTY